MRNIATSILLVTFLSGCALTSNQEQITATQSAILQSENNINQKLSNLESSLSNQNDYIESLESEMLSLQGDIQHLKNKPTFKMSAFKNSPKEQPVEKNTHFNIPKNANFQNLVILGEIESVSVDTLSQRFDARIDTGAETSSLNAVDIQEFERDGQKWVKFHLSDKKIASEQQVWIKAPILRYAKIRQSSSPSTEKRAVVELWVTLGDIHEKAQFTLADRSQMSHAILLGREFIQDIALVDVSKKHLHTESTKKIQ